MIASLEIGGSQTMVMNLYRNIDRDKVQFDFIVDHTEDKYFYNEIRSLGGRVYKLPTFKGTNILEVRKAWNRFFEKHSEYKILHSHSRSYASIYLPIAKKYGLKTIIHSHSTSNGSGITAVVKSMLQYPLRFQADYFMACSVEAGRWLFGDRVVKQKNFYVLKNAIDAKAFTYNPELREKYRSQLGINDEFVVGFLGRVMPPKNPMFMIDVFRELIKIESNSKLLFVGEGDLLGDVKKRAKQLGIIEKIIFTGARSDTPGFYVAMDVYCFPSLWEGLGISLIEAQASGLPCVCSENVPAAAIVTDLVETVELDKEKSYWAERLLAIAKKGRENTYKKIKATGYDIAENAVWMQEYYLEVC
ncbi:MAG: glycosyltransferase family 1 protein [Lachnospiraceae bacterium]|nr:glycosyltransferase family 1 protein [Lachnospiraceae bacterium]